MICRRLDGVLRNGVHYKMDSRDLSCSFIKQRYREKISVFISEEGNQNPTMLAPDLRLSPSELRENIPIVYQPLSPWYFVIAD
jgi:hypothetical protein